MTTHSANHDSQRWKDRAFGRRASVLAVAVRWIARVWALASTLLLSAFAFGGGENLRFTTVEAIAFLFFPLGIVAGFAIAWWRELTGGIVTVGCYVIFSLYLVAWDGRWPNAYFLLFSAPGFLHIASAILAQRLASRRLASVS